MDLHLELDLRGPGGVRASLMNALREAVRPFSGALDTPCQVLEAGAGPVGPERDGRSPPVPAPPKRDAGPMNTDTGPTGYQVLAIAPAVLAELRGSDDAGRPLRPYADPEGGAPLRCCLRYSREGELVALVSYAPLHRWAAERGVDPGAYDERGPIFIHADGADCDEAPSERRYPAAMHGQRVFRCYDAEGRILRGEPVPGADPEHAGKLADETLRALFADPEVALVHVRALAFGCFVLEARRTNG